MNKSNYLLAVLFFACQSGNAQVINDNPQLLALANNLPSTMTALLPPGVNVTKTSEVKDVVTNNTSKNALNEALVSVPPSLLSQKLASSDVYYTDTRDRMPSFPGGKEALMDFLASVIKYPLNAEEHGIQGRVVCSFSISKEGFIEDIKIKRSVNPDLDEEVIKALKEMPRWIPGKHKGKPVKVLYTLPITFNLAN